MRPGRPIKLLMKGFPNSTVAVAAVDKSIHFLAEGNDVKPKDVSSISCTFYKLSNCVSAVYIFKMRSPQFCTAIMLLNKKFFIEFLRIFIWNFTS